MAGAELTAEMAQQPSNSETPGATGYSLLVRPEQAVGKHGLPATPGYSILTEQSVSGGNVRWEPTAKDSKASWALKLGFCHTARTCQSTDCLPEHASYLFGTDKKGLRDFKRLLEQSRPSMSKVTTTDFDGNIVCDKKIFSGKAGQLDGDSFSVFVCAEGGHTTSSTPYWMAGPKPVIVDYELTIFAPEEQLEDSSW